ncbi:tetratricopeptide repeat protein [Priestia koreensis]|uniref:tetratricopeptide repeat protein n=1 Tax=Priestia koreensis TaxID=284581 RepID=UPI0034590EAC
MNFHPEAGQTIRLFKNTYSFAKHPAVFGMDMPYGQEGRQGTVYQLINRQISGLQNKKALKVFRDRFKNKQQSNIAKQIASFSTMYGLSVCERHVVTKECHATLLSHEEDLEFSLIMPWIDGPTWSDILLDNQILSEETCLHISCALVFTLKSMEEKGLAHCDLSSSNVLIPYLSHERSSSFSHIELVDIEEMYASHLSKPKALPGGSLGYAADYIKEGVWSEKADRFSGAILLVEMLTWFDESVRELKADDISYFNPEEIQQLSHKYEVVKAAVQNMLGDAGNRLFEQVWRSNSLEDCPSFKDWWDIFPEHAKTHIETNYANVVAQKKMPVSIPSFSLSSILAISASFELIGNRRAAIAEYQYLLETFPEQRAIVEEIHLLLNGEPLASVRQSFELDDYLEAAPHFEKLGELEKAMLFYERACSLPSSDEVTKNELRIIIDELKQKVAQQKQSSDYKLNEPFAPSVQTPLSTETNANPSSNRKFSFISLAKVKWILIAIGILFIASTSTWIYQYVENKKWEESIQKGAQSFDDGNLEAARTYIQAAIEKKPTEELYAKMATILISEAKYNNAATYLSNLVARNQISEKNQEAYYLIGRAYFLTDNYQAASAYYEKAKEGKKSQYEQDVLRDLAVSYGKMGQYDKANNIVNRLNSSKPPAKAFKSNLKGELYMLKGQLNLAKDSFREAVKLDPKKNRYVQNLANTYIAINQTNQIDDQTKEFNYSEAIRLMSSLVQSEVSNATSLAYLTQLAQLYQGFGLYYKAKNNPLSQKQFEAAVDYYKQADALTFNQDNLVNMASIYDQLKQYDQSSKIYERILVENPSYGHGYYLYGISKLYQKKYEDAKELLKKSVQFNTDPIEITEAKKKLTELKQKGYGT